MEILYGCLLVTSILAGCQAIMTRDPQCRNITFVENVEAFCVENPRAKLPHPDDCSAYFDCSFSFEGIIPRYFSQHMKICEYPSLYDPHKESCEEFQSVSCCDRNEPIAPCDYRNFKCPFAHCQPCEFNRPSCIGLRDGAHSVLNRNRFYFRCSLERTMQGSVQSCPQNRQFDPRVGGCAPIRLNGF